MGHRSLHGVCSDGPGLHKRIDSFGPHDLAGILKYHVISGAVMSTDLQPTQDEATLQGAKVTITKGAKVMFADAEVTAPNNVASNGVVHVIDKVVLPPDVTTTSNEVIDSSISMHGHSRFAVVLVTAAMFWGAR